MTEGVAQLGLVLDCADPGLLAERWAPALGYVNLGAARGYVDGQVRSVTRSGRKPEQSRSRMSMVSAASA